MGGIIWIIFVIIFIVKLLSKLQNATLDRNKKLKTSQNTAKHKSNNGRTSLEQQLIEKFGIDNSQSKNKKQKKKSKSQSAIKEDEELKAYFNQENTELDDETINKHNRVSKTESRTNASDRIDSEPKVEFLDELSDDFSENPWKLIVMSEILNKPKSSRL